MNTDVLISLIPGAAVVFLIIGFYKTALEKQVQAQEHIQGLLGKQQKASINLLTGKAQDLILKKRKKSKDGQLTKIDQLEIKLERANLLITAKEFLMICMGSAVLGGILSYFCFGQNMLLAILGGIGSTFLPYGYLL